jgi:hypothetical protein
MAFVALIAKNYCFQNNFFKGQSYNNFTRVSGAVA